MKSEKIKAELDKVNARIEELQPQSARLEAGLEGAKKAFGNKKICFDDLKQAQAAQTLMVDTVNGLRADAANLQRLYDETVARENRQLTFEVQKVRISRKTELGQKAIALREKISAAAKEYFDIATEIGKVDHEFAAPIKAEIPGLERIDPRVMPKHSASQYKALIQEMESAGISEEMIKFMALPIVYPAIPFDTVLNEILRAGIREIEEASTRKCESERQARLTKANEDRELANQKRYEEGLEIAKHQQRWVGGGVF